MAAFRGITATAYTIDKRCVPNGRYVTQAEALVAIDAVRVAAVRAISTIFFLLSLLSFSWFVLPF